MQLRSCWIVLQRYKKAKKSSEFFYAGITSTLSHNHTISTTYKLTLMHRHNTPTSVAQPLNFSDRMAWFHKQSAAYWQLCCGWGHYLGRAISIDRPLYKEEWQGWPESCGDPLLRGYVTLVVQRCTSKQGTEELNVCRCVHAGWYYYQLGARVGWMASVLSLEHSLFTLMNTTPTPLKPIAKRAFAYWSFSKAGNHRGYEYTWEQCFSF